MSHPRRVVITGMGLVSPLGNDLKSFWDNLSNGRSGIGPITLFDVTQYDCRIAGEVKNFDPATWFNNPRDARRSDS
jgi:3-oxoacyl-[acyl-carrier-protein] synthase II